MKAVTRHKRPSNVKTAGMPTLIVSLVVPRKSSGVRCSIVPIYQIIRKTTSNNFLLLLNVPKARASEGMNKTPASKEAT